MSPDPATTTTTTTTATTTTAEVGRRRFAARIVASFVDAGEIPTVRLIGLERRPDRALDFAVRAVQREGLVVLRGPGTVRKLRREEKRRTSSLPRGEGARGSEPPEREGDDEDDGDGEDAGYAFDGLGGHDDLELQLARRLMRGGDGRGEEEGAARSASPLSDYVAAKWRPSDLKAFDRDAPDGFDLVKASPTERACALSHVASWMGVESTLLASCSTAGGEHVRDRHLAKLLRTFETSGFARGPALLPANASADPTPVCVILEDDAVPCDRFAERLACLLEELPRDFHFCSLGYSRPKAAPMVEYSSQLGVPSCLWYLTGYVLSLEGARHLIESLPVTGPVDSWMGLKMCENWTNKFGDRLGVGKFAKAKAKLPSRKDLARIMWPWSRCAPRRWGRRPRRR
ncbi:hypothetical protein ACHAWF_015620 [Thalassiosira exigua]